MKPFARHHVSTVVCYLFVLLFVYAGVSKALEFENFQAQLGQSPLLSAYTGIVSYTVIAVELVIAIMLTIPVLRLAGLFCAFGLMVLFCAYILIITNYSSFVPCSCGGILEGMEWKGHLVFNVCFTAIAAAAIFLLSAPDMPRARRHCRTQALKLGAITISGSAFMCLLYACSEQAMHEENPFIRRFVQFTATKEDEKDIKSNMFYFAGVAGNRIFLGSHLAPLHVIEYDSLMRQTAHHKITLSTSDFSFRSIQVRVQPPYFYVMDGTVPVIYRGNTSDWKASVVMQQKYFSKAEIVDSVTVAYRGRHQVTRDNVLGLINFNEPDTLKEKAGLLQKQIDGFFDTDGTMQYDAENKKFVYTYFYRNQFIVTDNKLNLLYRGKTIDTTTRANIKVAFIKETGERKLASVPDVVNYLTAISGNLLFVNSRLHGRYEAKDMWDTSTAVDIYDLNKNIYLSSIYLYHVEDSKPSDFKVFGNNLYTIVGHYMHRYSLNLDLINGKRLPAGDRDKIENLQ